MPRFVIGNWKMHTTRDEAVALAASVSAGLGDLDAGLTVGVAPPFCFLEAVGHALAGSSIELVAQDVHPETHGAFTSAVSAGMLASLGVNRVIVGHSERRHLFGDDDAIVAAKLRAALAEGMHAILCVGEQLAQREAGEHQAIVKAQVEAGLEGLSDQQRARVSVAYEPVWAIGTGVTATSAQAGEMHEFIGRLLEEGQAVLYGGSVKPNNAEELAATPGINGFLVGGASLKADLFLPIVRSCVGQADARS